MSNSIYPVLCGGTYFTLVLEARGQRTSQRSRFEGEQDGLSQSETLVGLGKVVYPEYAPPQNKQTFNTNVSAYKSCTNDGSNLSFLFPDKVAAFDSRIKNEYTKVLKAMCDFVDQFLEVNTSIQKEKWLIKALLELIGTDQSIDESQEFFICSDGRGITKATMRLTSNFVLQPFLLGVWHYVMMNRSNNKSGKTTFDTWCPPMDRAVRKYEGNMGEKIKRKLNVEVLTTPTEDASTTEAETPVAVETLPTETVPSALDADPKRITVNNYGIVQNQKFISVETMNGDINL